MTLTVSLDKPLDIPVDVDVSYMDVTATGGGTDYDSVSGQVTFAAGDTADKTVTVAITDDSIDEAATETFTAGLSTGTPLGGRAVELSDTGLGTIRDNDNEAPELSNVSITSPVELGSDATLTGQIFDPGTRDTFILEVDWGDGTRDTFPYPAGTTTFSAIHVYTSHGDRKVTVSVRDDDGGSDQDTDKVVAVDQILGPVDHWEGTFDASGGEIWVAMETTHDGILTVGTPDADAQLQLLDQVDKGQRMDCAVGASETYCFMLTGTTADVEVYVCNLVSVTGTSVTVHGTNEADQFHYAPTGSHQVVINGVEYRFEDAEVSSVQFIGGLGDNTATLVGSSANETLTVRPSSATFELPGMQVQVADTVRVVANGGGGRDIGNLYGGAGADTYTGNPSFGRLIGDGFFQRASGFAEIYVHLEEGDDIARLYGTPEDDTFVANPYQGTLTCPSIDVLHQVENFRELNAFSEGGNDTAELADDPAEESYVVTFHALAGTEAKLFDGDRHGAPGEVNQIFLIRTRGFASPTATAGPGDTALLYGTGGDDHYLGTPSRGSLTVPSGAVFTAVSFEEAHSVAKGGRNNTGELNGSSEKERFWGTQQYGRLGGSDWLHRLVRYDQVTVDSGGGPDVAEMFDTPFRDTFSGWPEESKYEAGRFEYLVQGFPTVRVNGDGVTGDEDPDTAYLYPSPDDEIIERLDDWLMKGEGYSIKVEKSFGEVVVHGDSGSGSTSALAGPDAFSPQALLEHDLAVLAEASLRGRASDDPDDRAEAAVDSVLRTEFWWNGE
jgi:hypothetical protein